MCMNALTTSQSYFGHSTYHILDERMKILSLLSIFLGLLHTNLCQEPSACLTWFYHDDTSEVSTDSEWNCKCGNSLRKVVKCNEISRQVQVLQCYGMTYSDRYNTTVVGNSLLHCSVWGDYYTPADYRCERFNRTGQLCGKCKSEYVLPVFSYSLRCIKCDNFNKYNTLKYVAVAFLPVTVFYLTVVMFKFRATDPIICEFVLYSQFVTSYAVRFVQSKTRLGTNSGTRFEILCFMIFGIWNLDFGRFIYNPFCLHPDLTTHQVIALDYLVAFYPLLLILLTYLLVKLHDRYKLVVVIWKPFYTCIRCIQKEWNVKASLVDVFATFILLSNVKLLNVSLDLISVPITLWDVHGRSMPVRYTHINGSMEYLGKEHIPYFVLGTVVLFVFNILPILLLCLYPFRWFQRCLNSCSLRNPSLHIFMDAFQGCYKTSPRDYRCLSALPFIVRLSTFLFFFLTLNRFSYSLFAVMFIFMVCIIASILPFKTTKQNTANIFVYQILCCLCFSLNTPKLSVFPSRFNFYVFNRIIVISYVLPLLSVILYYSWKFIPKKSIRRLLSRFKVQRPAVVPPPPLRGLNELCDENSPLV